MKTKVIVALATALAIMAGCATTMSLPDQLDKFVEKTEKEYKTYTEKEWEKSQEEYEELKAKINESYDSFSTSDKVRTMKAMGKYGSFVLEKELAGASETIGSVLESIPQTINDIIDEIESNTIIVLELSCHQLEYVQASPHVAILLNLYEEHFDHYAKPEDYFNAKKNIFHFQHSNDLLIYGDIFQHAHQEEIDALPMHKINLLQDHIVDFDKIQTSLIGEHYKYDIAAAIAACEEFGLSEEQCLQAVASFKGLRHRLEFVGEFQGIKFYNDSIATAQEAVIQAINAIPSTDTIILGGMDRGLDYHPLVDFIRHSNIRNVILLPDTDATFQRIFDEAPYSQNVLHVTNLEEAVKISFEATAEGHSCLLSPAAASYGFFKNFEERGDVFCQLVQKYAKLKAEA